MSIETASFEERDTELHKYNHLQFKVMEAMGFGIKRSELDWDGQGYSDRYRKIFEKSKAEDPEFMKLIPVKIADPAWGSDELKDVIKAIATELEIPMVQ